MKKITSLVLSVMLVFGVFVGLAANADAVEPTALRYNSNSYDSGRYYYLWAGGPMTYVIPHGTYIGDGYANLSYYVTGVQESLDKLNRVSMAYGDTLYCYPGAIDGFWGPNTKNAVIAMQAYNGTGGCAAISADGIIGPNTWIKFINMLNGYE